MIATPNSKRVRNREDEWDGLQDVQEGASSPRTPVRAGRKLQTPMHSFLVYQTPEQRRKQLQKPVHSQPDMSASPLLKRKPKSQTGAKIRKLGRPTILQQQSGTVAKIIQYFRDPHMKQEEGNCDRRQMLAQPTPCPTENTGTGTSPEMALPVSGGTQPMAQEPRDHVTQKQEQPPMRDCQPGTAKTADQTGHV